MAIQIKQTIGATGTDSGLLRFARNDGWESVRSERNHFQASNASLMMRSPAEPFSNVILAIR